MGAIPTSIIPFVIWIHSARGAKPASLQFSCNFTKGTRFFVPLSFKTRSIPELYLDETSCSIPDSAIDKTISIPEFAGDSFHSFDFLPRDSFHSFDISPRDSSIQLISCHDTHPFNWYLATTLIPILSFEFTRHKTHSYPFLWICSPQDSFHSWIHSQRNSFPSLFQLALHSFQSWRIHLRLIPKLTNSFKSHSNPEESTGDSFQSWRIIPILIRSRLNPDPLETQSWSARDLILIRSRLNPDPLET